MKTKTVLLVFLLITALVLSGCAHFYQDLKDLGQEDEFQISSNFEIVDGKTKVLIGFLQKPGQAEFEQVKGLGGEITRTFEIVPAIAAKIPSVAIDKLSQNPKIRYVEPDVEVFALGQTVPWGIDRVFGGEEYVFETWDITRGDGIAVAILDTGIDENHEDLPALLGGVTTVDNTHWGSDGSGHGTHVAGTVAALDNNIGVVGVGPEIGIYAVKVLSDGGSGSVDSVVAGIDWAVKQGIPILNMSLGSSTHSQTLKEACDAAYLAGHLIVASAGNNGNPAGRGDNVGYPAAYESVIAIAASADNDRRANYSSTGPAVELIAPGSSILSTIPGNGYGTKSGTSMASPHAAGVAALAWAANPTLTNVELREVLQITAEDLGLASNHQGYGLVRADLAVREVADIAPPETGKVAGTVRDGENKGIEGASVIVEGTSLLATTDGIGYYLIENVPAGNQEVKASADGYYSATATVNVIGNETVTQDFNLVEITIETFTVSGSVKDIDGVALQGASVVIEGTDFSAETDASGSYTIGNVAEGIYDITASKDGYAPQTENVNVVADKEVNFVLAEAGVEPVIEKFELINTSNPAWARVTVEWSVSSNIGLASVKSEMLLEGSVLDSKTSSISGTQASGNHELRNRGGQGQTYTIILTVIDNAGETASKTKEIDL